MTVDFGRNESYWRRIPRKNGLTYLPGSVVDHEEAQPEHIHRDMLRLCGRQVLLDLLVRIERERQRELQGLLEHRTVSDLVNRNMIQVGC
ncbi:hypothetical protein CQW23_30010 [Capsicum baccatum]|uniref:Uncharacterized protein n=1 Tax=Capsicum baccatum TaxID=33114 RepID=A0A2G2VBS2_CAPBA|nr:hypothetical protein CQW23_30010 [Capsicum baccatum]